MTWLSYQPPFLVDGCLWKTLEWEMEWNSTSVSSRIPVQAMSLEKALRVMHFKILQMHMSRPSKEMWYFV